MFLPKIAVIIGSTRAARFGHVPGQWITGVAKKRKDIEEIILPSANAMLDDLSWWVSATKAARSKK